MPIGSLTAAIAPTLTSPPCEIDPSAPGTIIRYAFALEATLNLIGAIPLFTSPSSFLRFLFANPHTDITPATASLAQWLGAFVLALTPQLLLALPNTREAVESRRTIYCTLAAGELGLIPVLLFQAARRESGLRPHACLALVGFLGPPLGWRAWVLWWRPGWFGRVREVRKGE